MAFICKTCFKVYPNESCLHTHIRVVHKMNPSLEHIGKDCHYLCLEEKCELSFKASEILMSHLKSHHGFKFEHAQITVATMDEFFEWKTSIEKDQVYKYILKNTLNNKKYKSLYYRCTKFPKLEQKSTSTRQTYCTSQLKLYQEHGERKVTIFWIKTHYGHDLGNLELQQKIEEDNILPTIKNNKEKYSRKKRKILELYDSDSSAEMLTFEDNYLKFAEEIKFAVKPNKQKIKPNLKTIANSENDPILFHKRQETRRVEHFETNDLCLIIMNDYQKDILKQFGNNVVIVDSTQSLSNHEFDLTTLSILDEYNKGFPVAYMLCNRKDILTFTFFFKTIHKVVGVIEPKIFMSDLIESYYDAWIKVMGPTTHQLFCPWRIEQAWTLDLNKITNVEKRKEVSDNLITLQKELEEYNFQIMLNDILEYLLEDGETEQFGKYFKNNYSSNYQKWAFCVQQEYGINPDVDLESVHELTNYFELVLLRERSFDKVLQTLFKYIKDKVVERNLKIDKDEKPFSDYQVEYIDNYWNVQDKNEIVFKVTKISDEKCCESICLCCNMCLHMYTCDCFNYLSKKIICIHIHCVLNYLEEGDQVFKRTNELTLFDTDMNQTKTKIETNNLENSNENCSKSNHVKNDNISELKQLIDSTFSKLQTIKLDSLNYYVSENIATYLNVINDLLISNEESNDK